MLSMYALSFPHESKARCQHKLDLVGFKTCPYQHIGLPARIWENDQTYQMATDPNCIQTNCYSVSSKDDFIKGSQFVPYIVYNIIAFLEATSKDDCIKNNCLPVTCI